MRWKIVSLFGAVGFGLAAAAYFIRTITPSVPTDAAPDRLRTPERSDAAPPPPAPAATQAGLSEAMAEPARYCSTRLRDIKAAPEAWRFPQVWRAEFDAAPNDTLKAEVVGLARQVDPKAFLAILSRALAVDDLNLRLSAARHLGQLPESLLPEGITIGVHASDPFIREEVLNVASNSLASLRPTLLGVALRSSPFAETRLAASILLMDRPDPASFEALLSGLDDKDGDVRSAIQKRIENQIGQSFETAGSARVWWKANQERFDAMLLRIPGT